MIEFTLNGKRVGVDVEADTPLLWVLREQLQLLGTKFGCGMGLCGACTVHVAGAAVRSCQMQIASVAGQMVTTIEGLAATSEGATALTNANGNASLHVLQQAWIEGNVPQCGYCQSGQLMSAAALLAEKPQPSDEDIDVAMSGNLCRCGMYGRIRTAIHRAAQLQSAAAGNQLGVQLFDPAALTTRGVA